jgi:pimeloyl-ACP methyl ester carboxylesterase
MPHKSANQGEKALPSSRKIAAGSIEIFLLECRHRRPDRRQARRRRGAGAAQKLIVDGAGHWIQQKRPDTVNAALLAFLREKVAG